MIHRVWLASVLLFVLLSPALASEDAAADLAACRKLVGKKRWADAVKAYEALFKNHKGSSDVIAAHRDIEDDLKTCSFRLVYKRVEPKDLWGEDNVKKFGKTSLKVELSFVMNTRPLWSFESGFWILNIRFRDRITVEVDGEPRKGDRPLLVLLCYDIEKKGGYLLAPGETWMSGAHIYSLPLLIARLDGGKHVDLVRQKAGYKETTFKFIRDSTSIRLYKGKKQVAKAVDRRYKGGYIAIGNAWPDEIRIFGRLDEGFWRKLAGEHEEKAFAEWQKKKWNPAKAIPAWVRQPAAAPTASKYPKIALPSDARHLTPNSIANLLDRCMNGDPAATLELLPIRLKQPPRTAAWLGAFCSLGMGQFAAAEPQLSRVIQAEPEFAPAWALRGLVRLMLRRIEEARADFAAARKADEKLGWAYFGQVQLAIYEGDLDRAASILAQARSAGARSPWLEGLPERVHRAKRGPLWTRRFEITTSHFRIASDHSRDLCRQVAHNLEAAIESYGTYFPDVKMPKRKARVYVFANRSGYLGYAKSVAKDLTWAAGAYDPTLRELVLFLPENRRHFVHTVRHEGFHGFVHEYLERAPMWFNEGCAEYFASASKGFGVGLKFGAPYEDALVRLYAAKGKLTPVADLLTMPRKEFMAKALLHYAQSWALVHYMLKTKGNKMRLAFRAYFKSLRDGLSEAEAFKKHLEPLVERIEKGYKEHFRSLEVKERR